MSGGTWFVLAITVQYAIAGIFYGAERDYGSMIMFLAYALANIGYLYSKGLL